MRFLFSKTSMLDAISIAQEVISTKNINSILSSILIIAKEETVFIRATDSKINYEAQISAQISETGTAVVYCNKFIEILNSFSSSEGEEIEFFQEEYEENKEDIINVIIRPIKGKINFQIKGTPYKKFPEFYFEINTPCFEFPLKEFKEMLAQTSFAVSVEETRYFLNGVFFEKKGNDLVLVATDGRRLSFVSKPILLGINDFPSAIVHPKILNIILKYAPKEGSILVAIIEKRIFFKFANYEFSVMFLDGQFPNYDRVIPKKQSFVFYVKRMDLANALNKHILLMLDRKIGRIYFNISQNRLKITSFQPDVGRVEEEISCEFSGVPCTIAFNFSYIEEPLKVIKTEKVAFEFTEEMKAVTLRPEPAKDYFHIIMPMYKDDTGTI